MMLNGVTKVVFIVKKKWAYNSNINREGLTYFEQANKH